MTTKTSLDPAAVLAIDLEADCWSYVWLGRRIYIRWSALELHPGVAAEAKRWAQHELPRRKSPKWLIQVKTALNFLAKQYGLRFASILELGVTEWHALWRANRRNFPVLREFHAYIETETGETADSDLMTKLAQWPRVEPEGGAFDLWGEQGALTRKEVQALKKVVHTLKPGETTREHVARLYVRFFLETGKRGNQVLNVRAGDVLDERREGVPVVRVRIPKFKEGVEAGRYWPVSGHLADDLASYCARRDVKELQRLTGQFFVADEPTCRENGALELKVVQRWVDQLLKGVVSPRTGRQLRVNARRLRHTFATRAALNGKKAREIADLLEHSDEKSCGRYVDVNPSDYAPELAQLDDRLMGALSYLEKAAMTGRHVSVENDAPIKLFATSPATTLGYCWVGAGKCPGINLPFDCYACGHFRPVPEVHAHRLAKEGIEALSDDWAQRNEGHRLSRAQHQIFGMLEALADRLDALRFDR